MTPPDLGLYVHTSKKLSPQDLGAPAQGPSVLKILAAHLVDFWMVVASATAVLGVLKASASGLMVTSKLSRSLELSTSAPMLFFMIAGLGFCYFFFSYFFNHGQTYGMHLLRLRVNLPHYGLRACLRWTLFSLALCLSGGLTIPVRQLLRRTGDGEFSVQDVLYQKLMEPRTLPSVNLVRAIELAEAQEEREVREAA
jgi:hypothetical protein